MQTFEASVTFEYDIAKPLTAKLTVSATDAATACARAVRGARKQLPPLSTWRSLVCVLERVLPPGETARAGEADAEPVQAG